MCIVLRLPRYSRLRAHGCALANCLVEMKGKMKYVLLVLGAMLLVIGYGRRLFVVDQASREISFLGKSAGSIDEHHTHCVFEDHYVDCAVAGGLETADDRTWRRFNPGLARLSSGTYVYVERQGRFIRERRDDVKGKKEVFWIKSNRFVFSTIEFSNSRLKIDGLSTTLLDPFPNGPKQDCELQPDWIDGGHGAADARFFRLNATLYIVFNSRPKTNTRNEWCPISRQRSMYIGEMHFDVRGKTIVPSVQKTVGLRIKTDDNTGVQEAPIERNWSPFEFDGQLYFSYSLYPQHVVLRCAAVTGECVVAHRSNTTGAFKKLKQFMLAKDAKAELGPHGGTPAILNRYKNGTSFYLGVLHCYYKFKKGLREYFNFAYKMEGEPPFRIIDVAQREFPFLKNVPENFRKVSSSGPNYYRSGYMPNQRIAFASDMTKSSDDGQAAKFLISYGRHDAEARLFEISMDDLERKYFR